MEPNDDETIKLWYDGLGQAYRHSRGTSGSGGSCDTPRMRQIYYIVWGGMMVAVGVVFLRNLYLFEVVWILQALVAMVALLVIFMGGRVLQVAWLLEQTLRSGADLDRADRYRMQTLRRAVRWGMRRGLVAQNGQQGWYLKQDR